MITKNFCDTARVQLFILGLPLNKCPQLDDMYDKAINLLFKTNDIMQASNVFASYKWLKDNYLKVFKAVNSKKWDPRPFSSFEKDLYRDFLISPKKKKIENLIYITNFFHGKDKCYFMSDKELIVKDVLINKKKPDCSYICLNGIYYLFDNNYFKNTRKKDLDLDLALASFYLGGEGKSYFVQAITNCSYEIIEDVMLIIKEEKGKTKLMSALFLSTLHKGF